MTDSQKGAVFWALAGQADVVDELRAATEGWLRNLGLLLFDVAPPAKSALARVSAGFAGPTPRLARGLSVRP